MANGKTVFMVYPEKRDGFFTGGYDLDNPVEVKVENVKREMNEFGGVMAPKVGAARNYNIGQKVLAATDPFWEPAGELAGGLLGVMKATPKMAPRMLPGGVGKGKFISRTLRNVAELGPAAAAGGAAGRVSANLAKTAVFNAAGIPTKDITLPGIATEAAIGAGGGLLQGVSGPVNEFVGGQLVKSALGRAEYDIYESAKKYKMPVTQGSVDWFEARTGRLLDMMDRMTRSVSGRQIKGQTPMTPYTEFTNKLKSELLKTKTYGFGPVEDAERQLIAETIFDITDKRGPKFQTWFNVSFKPDGTLVITPVPRQVRGAIDMTATDLVGIARYQLSKIKELAAQKGAGWRPEMTNEEKLRWTIYKTATDQLKSIPGKGQALGRIRDEMSELIKLEQAYRATLESPLMRGPGNIVTTFAGTSAALGNLPAALTAAGIGGLGYAAATPQGLSTLGFGLTGPIGTKYGPAALNLAAGSVPSFLGFGRAESGGERERDKFNESIREGRMQRAAEFERRFGRQTSTPSDATKAGRGSR